MTTTERVIRGSRVAMPEGVRPAALHIAHGRIAAVTDPAEVPREAELVDAGDAMVFPGLVDTHVHINEPGRTEWEGFATATRAAAAGGVTTLVDMPLNSIPPTTTVAALETKRHAARGQCVVDVGFLGGVVPGNTDELSALHHAGVFGFKAFLCPSGVPEFAPVSAADLQAALKKLAGLDTVLMTHCELEVGTSERRKVGKGYSGWLESRPAETETLAARLLMELARATGARVHVVHVSAPETATLIAAMRARGVRVTGETCPHYLTFAAGEIPNGATEYKCAPPIRDSARRDGLWVSLERGRLDIVVSDHSPAPAALRRREQGEFLPAWGGIASLQLRLPAVWTGARARGIAVDRLVEWLCTGPARLVGLDGRKGSLRPGHDADVVIWRPEEEFVVESALLRHRHALTPWLGRRLAGVVEATYLRGTPVFRRGAEDPAPSGVLLRQTAR